jgi:hypothetical protein
MTTELLTEKYADRLDGVLHCYDGRSIQPWCYALLSLRPRHFRMPSLRRPSCRF